MDSSKGAEGGGRRAYQATLHLLSSVLTEKLANVHISKKPQKGDPRKYRPVSLMLLLEKVMEQIILSAVTGDQAQPAQICE